MKVKLNCIALIFVFFQIDHSYSQVEEDLIEQDSNRISPSWQNNDDIWGGDSSNFPGNTGTKRWFEFPASRPVCDGPDRPPWCSDDNYEGGEGSEQ